MWPSLTLPAFTSTLALLSLLACGGGTQPGAAAPSPAGPVSLERNVLTATCKEYDLGAGTMDVIAGLSFALREITFKVHDSTVITIGDRRAALSDMRAGMVLRIEYRVTSQGNLADKVELVMDASRQR